MKDTRRTRPTKSIKQSSPGLTVSEAGSMQPAWICTRSFAYTLSLYSWCFCGAPQRGRGAGISLSPLPVLGIFFPSYWFALSRLNMVALPCLIVLCFFLFCCGLFEICSFLKRKWSGRGSGRKGSWKAEGAERGETG